MNNQIPLFKLQNTDIPLVELMDRFHGRPVGFEVSSLDGVMLLLPNEDYDFVSSAIQARMTLPTRATRLPVEYYAETVHTLRELEQRYGMTSADFYRQFQEGTLPEGPNDYWEWRTRYKSLLNMQERYGFSEAEVVHA